MTVIQFDDAVCRRIRAWLHAYLNDELSVESVAEVARHLKGCVRCSAELAEMEKLRAKLRGAVADDTAPADLRRIVQGRLDREYRRRRTQWLAIAAALAISMGGGFVASKKITGYLPHELLAIELEVRSLVREVAAAYAPAIIDHVHCALYRSGPKTEVMPEKVAMELGDQAPVADIVKQAAGDDATLLIAHKCHFGGREYVHMILMKGEGLVSVVITDKQDGETLGPGLEATQAGRFQIAGFEAGGRLAFVISDLSAEANLEMARALEAPIRAFVG